MALTPHRIDTHPRRHALPQPKAPAWSAALAPSQRRAADRRAQLAQRRSAQRWLRGLAGRW